MMIEELQLINFKSFKRATIVIPKGLIAITGPNGSGKSNILDAIAFLMGWRAKRLRASRLEHLVRRGAPWAQVNLTIVNSGERIKIQRRVKPNGKSSYRVNDKSLPAHRVMDILSSLGLVAERYTFVTQGDITSIVEMSPGERYEILKEISGISDYDERRDKALEELKEVEQLLREISAVLREKEKELRRVEEEIRILEERSEVEGRYKRIKKYQVLSELKLLRERLSSLEEPKPEEIDTESLRRELERKEEEMRSLESSLKDSPVRRRGQIMAELGSLRRQREALRKALEAKEEVIRSIMRGREIPSFIRRDPSFLGTVSELIRPLPGYELPFIAVGSGRLNDIVVRDLEGAKRIARALREVEGRFRIIPMDVLKGEERRERGLYNFLLFDREYEALTEHIFNAILIDDLDEVSEELLGRARYVTMDGEIVEREGSIVAGKPSLGNIGKLMGEINDLRDEIQQIDEEISSKERELMSLPERDREFERLDSVRKEVHELRRKYQEALSRREDFIRRTRKVIEERSEILAKIKVLERELEDLSDVDPLEVPDPRKEIVILEMKLRSLGNANPKAREEYKRRKEEFEEAKSKYDSFLSRKEEVESLIERIDSEREGILRDTLRKLSDAFNSWISLLFEGGSGELLLSERGLEMRVNLPGKGSINIDSLSGGEKSLSALAFILASQRVRPSSLYLFDEADAMLDGMNCKRYARALKELSKGSIVMMISLKREALEEADYIIGVTVRGGESKVIAVERSIIGS
jgi:chromosome segregation protein